MSAFRNGAPKQENIFVYAIFQETAGANADLTTSIAITDTPTYKLNTITKPVTMKKGIIKQIRLRLNWANAVNLLSVRIYDGAFAGNYECEMHKLFDSDEFIAALVDDTEYVWDVEIPFILEDNGSIYFAPEWSAACGNIQGYIIARGVKLE